jgi:hypothetical protein
VKKSEAKTATKRVNRMGKKISKSSAPLFIPNASETPAPKAYTREEIEAILTNVMLVSVSLAAVLLTLSIFITVVRN